MTQEPHEETLEKAPRPAALVSDAFISFMHMRTELSQFVEFYHRMAKQAVSHEGDLMDKEMYEEYRGHSVFFLENYITRVSDLFDLYIEHLVYAVCLKKRDFLSERTYEKAAQRLKNLGISQPVEDEILFEASIHFGQQDKVALAKHFVQAIGFDMPAKLGSLWTDALFCKKIRNLIVHKASVVDERFVEHAKDKECPFDVAVGEHLVMPEAWILSLASKVDSCTMLIDDALSDYVAVHKRNRYGHFWLPRSVWSNPLRNNPEKETHGEK